MAISRKNAYGIGAFRTSIGHYAAGRLANAAISVVIFLTLARQLTTSDYGAYVVLVALLEVAFAVSVIGFDWLTAVEIPKLQMARAGYALSSFVNRCVLLQGMALVLIASAVWFFSDWLVQAFDLSVNASLIQVYAAVVLTEGLSRVHRDQLLSSLLMQWAAQLAQLLRNGIVLLVVALLYWGGHNIELKQVAWAELAASSLSLLLGMGLLQRRLMRERVEADPSAAKLAPAWSELRPLALNAWQASLTNLLWSGQVIVMLVSRFAGNEAAAVLGFARNLAEQLRRLMPIEFLFNFIRSFLVSRFAPGREAELLNRVAVLVRLNAVLVLPLAVVTFFVGDALSGALSGGKFSSAGAALTLWLVWIVVWSHHRLSDLTAHLFKCSGAVGRASLIVALLALPAFVTAAFSGSALLVLALLVVSEFGYVWLTLRWTLQARGLTYPLSQLRLWRLLLPAGASAAVMAWVHLSTPIWLGIGGALVFAMGAAALRVVSLVDFNAFRGPAQPAARAAV